MTVRSLYLTKPICQYLQSYLDNLLWWLSQHVLSHHIMSIYPIVHIQMSFVRFSFFFLLQIITVLSKHSKVSVYYCIRCGIIAKAFKNQPKNIWLRQIDYDSFLCLDMLYQTLISLIEDKNGLKMHPCLLSGYFIKSFNKMM